MKEEIRYKEKERVQIQEIDKGRIGREINEGLCDGGRFVYLYKPYLTDIMLHENNFKIENGYKILAKMFCKN